MILSRDLCPRMIRTLFLGTPDALAKIRMTDRLAAFSIGAVLTRMMSFPDWSVPTIWFLDERGLTWMFNL